MVTNDLIKSLRKREEALRDELYKIEEQIRAESLRLVEEKYDVHIGMDVIYRNKRYKISSIDPFDGFNKPWISGRMYKKDGTIGTAERLLYSGWTIATDTKEPTCTN